MVTETPTRRFSVEEVLIMDEAGVFKPDERFELIEGEIIPMLPIGPFHSDAVDELVELFNARARGRWRVRGEHPLALGPDTLPQPDVALVRRRRYGASHPKPEDVYLLVEVADSSLRFDRSRKLPLYAKAGIPEVWIINLRDRTIEVHREPQYTGFSSTSTSRRGDTVSPAAFSDVQINVAELLDAAE
jgi:hypothetical protein